MSEMDDTLQIKDAADSTIQVIELPTDPTEKAEVLTMIEIWRGGSGTVLEDLRSTKTETIPFNQPTAQPISFSGGNDPLNTALHVMLSIDQLRQNMKRSACKELKEIATAYESYLLEGKSDPIDFDLGKLRKKLEFLIFNSPGLDVNLGKAGNQTFANYSKSLLSLMNDNPAAPLIVEQATYRTSGLNNDRLAFLDQNPIHPTPIQKQRQFPVVNVRQFHEKKLLQAVFDETLLGESKGYHMHDSTQFNIAPPALLLNFEEKPFPETIMSDTLTLKRPYIRLSPKDTQYKVHSFSVGEITYLTTYEKVEGGKPRPYYWKIEGGAVKNISKDDFTKAMKEVKGGLLLVSEDQLRCDYERFYSPIRQHGSVSFERGKIDIRNPLNLDYPNDPDRTKELKQDPKILYDRVKEVIRTKANEAELTSLLKPSPFLFSKEAKTRLIDLLESSGSPLKNIWMKTRTNHTLKKSNS